jgi:hypothetical protein
VVPLASRYQLVFQDGSPADPGYFATALPSWRVGDRLATGTGPRYRIVAIGPVEEELGDKYAARWTVEPLPH